MLIVFLSCDLNDNERIPLSDNAIGIEHFGDEYNFNEGIKTNSLSYMPLSSSSGLQIHSSFQSTMSIDTNNYVIYVIRIMNNGDGSDLNFQWNSYDGFFTKQIITQTDTYTECWILWIAPNCSSSTRTITVKVNDDSGNSAAKKFLPVTVTGGNSCQVHEPGFDPPPGDYSNKKTISFKTDTPDAKVKYTIDGSDPRTSSTAIVGTNVFIDKTTTIKAYAYGQGWNDSEVVAAHYTITEYDGYSHRRAIVINHKKVGLNDYGILAKRGFPVLIALTRNWLKNIAVDSVNGRIIHEKGDDIEFRKANGSTKLYHEIEKYDSTTGTLVAWVSIGNLSKEEDTRIYMYYGKPDNTGQTDDPDKVWDKNFKGIWHLAEGRSGTGHCNVYKDSTGYDNHGKDYISSSGKLGKIGLGQKFDGNDDYIRIKSSPSLKITNAITISAWIKRLRINDYQSIFSKPTASGSDKHGNFEFYISCENNGLAFDSINTQPHFLVTSCDAAKIDDTDKWHHIAISRTDTGLVKFYVDGKMVSSSTMNGMFPIDANIIKIGASSLSNSYFYGYIDEVRLSNIARSAHWIRTGYNNQNNTSIGAENFIKYLGPEE